MARVRFWQVTSVFVWALSLIIGLFCAIMPPLNLVMVPAFLMLASGVVGAVSNKIDEAKASASSPKLYLASSSTPSKGLRFFDPKPRALAPARRSA